MRKFQEMCQEEFEKIELMARGGQKIVFDGVHNSYGETVIKLYFQLNDPRSIREIQIEKGLSLSMVPKIYETGIIERGVLNPNHQKSRAHRLKMAALRYCQSYLYSLLAYRPQCCNK